MFTLALSGLIGAGKSAVSSLLARYGARVIDLDAISHSIMREGSEVANEVAAVFPEACSGGGLDRRALGRIVFGDKSALERLESITVPAIWREHERLCREYEAQGARWCVVDIPLLLGSRIENSSHLNLIVDAPLDARISRLVATRGYSEAEACARMANQPQREELEYLADVMLANDASYELLELKVERFVVEVVRPYMANLESGFVRQSNWRAASAHEKWRAAKRLQAQGFGVPDLERQCASISDNLIVDRTLFPEDRPALERAGFLMFVDGTVLSAVPRSRLYLVSEAASA